jgi:peptide/nickel transport system substrate-binding protein
MKPDGIVHKKLFTDVSVRKAIAMLVPYEQINKVVYMNNYKRQAGPVCRHKQSFNSSLHPITYNFNDAVNLLKNAGWKDSDADGILDKIVDGVKTNFEFALNIYANIPDWQDFALLMQGEMKKAGIIVTINPLEVQLFLQNAHAHDFDMLLGVWSTSVTPEDYTQIWHSQSWTDNGDNYGGFGNAASDALIDSIKFTLDDLERNEMEKRFQQIVFEEQPYIFLFNSQRRIAVHKRFGNCELFFEKPGILLNNLKLLSSGTTVKTEVNP